MGKRSSFERIERDFYPTPFEAVKPLLPYLLTNVENYAEPCAGDGTLIIHLSNHVDCLWASDIDPQANDIDKKDALEVNENDLQDVDMIITNPPWSRNLLHPMIDHFRKLKPTWLLFDAGWMFTKQAKEFLPYCETILTVGRLKWIPDSKYTGKDDCCWYLFRDHEVETRFINK